MNMEKKQARPLTPTQKIAIERMWRLDELARKNARTWPERSRRYIELIQGFSTRLRVAIPKEIRNRFCKKCGNYWIEGENVTRRIKGKTLNSVCGICHSLKRMKMKAHFPKKMG
ncbi:MAG: ribonuclease P [Candidatus Diapherotrites archaeon]